MLEIKELLAPTGTKCRPGRTLAGFLGVTIHNTGNSSVGANALAHGKYLQGTGAATSASWHYAVDKDRAVRSIPEWEVAWHAGDGTGNGNYKTIAIEICMNGDGDLEKATDNAAELAADILSRHGMYNAASGLFQHHNWSGKNCPQMLRASKPYNWIAFIAKVQAHLDIAKGSGETGAGNSSNDANAGNINTGNGNVDSTSTNSGGSTLREEEMAKRYDTINELPASLQKEAQELVDCGALQGADGKLDVTEDMVRSMLIAKRYTDLLSAKTTK